MKSERTKGYILNLQTAEQRLSAALKDRFWWLTKAKRDARKKLVNVTVLIVKEASQWHEHADRDPTLRKSLESVESLLRKF